MHAHLIFTTPLFMNTDRRRILGPSDARVPVIGLSSGALAPATEKPQVPGEIRRFFVKTGLTKNANGLAYLEVDDTVLEVSVFGPRPIKGLFIDRASFSVECKFLPYITQPNEVIFNSGGQQNGRTGLTNIEHRISTYVETAFLPAILLVKYPKSTIDVFVNVVSFNSTKSTLLNLISWVVNCTSLAMVDSGIELRDMVTSGQVKLGKELITDPQISSEEDAEAGLECVASFMSMKNNELVAFWVEGDKDGQVTEEDTTKLLGGCASMSDKIRHNINGYLLLVAKGV